MDRIWSPWRYRYITQEAPEGGCIFCRIGAETHLDEENLVPFRGEFNFIVLNRYPYTNGHAMIVPYAHVATLAETASDTLREMIELTRRLESALRETYRPDGVNIGMNIGRAAGAGVAGHIHMHALPRWFADANFASVIGETRVLPEEPAVSWKRLRASLADGNCAEDGV